jgi:hypothetical protein
VTPTQLEAAQRLAAHTKFREALAKHGAGMRVAQTFDSGPYWHRLVGRDDCGADLYPDGSVSSDCGRGDPGDVVVEYPDLADPATLGVLDAILYEAGEGIVAVFPNAATTSRWRVMVVSVVNGYFRWLEHDAFGPLHTRGEALVAAILASWGAA